VLTRVADGVLVHESRFLRSNAIVVHGNDGVLLIDPGITGVEMACLANDLREMGQAVVAAVSTHPHWDHALWQADLGAAPRWATAAGAATLEALLSAAEWRDQVTEALPPEIAADVPLDLFGRVTGLPADTTWIPWDGPSVRIIEHRGHAPGHAALLIEERRVLVAGDMLSDILIPFLDLDSADAIGDYLDGLRRLEAVADAVDVVIPGHGSVARGRQVQARIDLDRLYVTSLGLAGPTDDPRLDPSAPNGTWLPDVRRWQVQQVSAGTR
jgi:glyoxylase-like metal-dependent hydrolase (beta-lactamase superfamily II)